MKLCKKIKAFVKKDMMKDAVEKQKESNQRKKEVQSKKKRI